MNAAWVRRLEIAFDGVASAALAAAVGFAAYRWLGLWTPNPQLGTFTALAAIVTCGLCWIGLSWVDVRPQPFPVAIFDLGAVAPPRPAELVLTEEDRLDDALLLDDVLTAPSPDSRVVRLFGPAAMPTPGQLKTRIDRHLDRETLDPPAPDDSQALYDALAEVRLGLANPR